MTNENILSLARRTFEETGETVVDFIFPKSLQMVIAAMKLKDACSLEVLGS